MQFACTGIKHCEHVHPEIIQLKPEYNRVQVEHIPKLRNEQREIRTHRDPSEILKEKTES
jgi:hypothetical protein